MIMANYCVFFLLFKQNYDVIFDFTGSFESAFICALIGKKRRYGISWRPHFRNAFDEVVDGYSKPQHLSNLNCDLVRKAGYNIKQKDCKYLLTFRKISIIGQKALFLHLKLKKWLHWLHLPVGNKRNGILPIFLHYLQDYHLWIAL